LRDRETERQRDRETERQRDRETERQRDRETERQRQRDRETERERQRETERDRETETEAERRAEGDMYKIKEPVGSVSKINAFGVWTGALFSSPYILCGNYKRVGLVERTSSLVKN
jgi:zinc finger CCCH domain-containing protein 13